LRRAQAFAVWSKGKTGERKHHSYDNTLAGVEREWDALNAYKKSAKPEKANEKLDVESAFNSLQAKLRVNNRPAFVPPEHLSPKALDGLWRGLAQAEKERADWLRKELERQQRLENLASRFWRKAKALLQWGADNADQLSSTDYGSNLPEVEAKLKNHEGFEASWRESEKRLEATKQLGQELVQENYSKAHDVQAKIGELDGMWSNVGSLNSQRRSGLEAELARQKYLEDLRLQFATRSRALISKIEDAEDLLAEPVRTSSSEAVQALQAAFDAFVAENSAHAAEYQALSDLNDKIASEGITSNMYSAFTFDQISARWTRLQTEVSERQAALGAEADRQRSNDGLCREFADKAKAFNDWCDEQRSEISEKSSEGDPEAQVKNLRQKAELIESAEIDDLKHASQKVDDAGIVNNSYTDITIETLVNTWEGLRELVRREIGVLEKELVNRNSVTGVSQQQLAEFDEAFKAFDKDGNGSLEKHEFRAAMQALGFFTDDAALDATVASIAKKSHPHVSFDEFVGYLVTKTQDSDTPDTIKAAFIRSPASATP